VDGQRSDAEGHLWLARPKDVHEAHGSSRHRVLGLLDWTKGRNTHMYGRDDSRRTGHDDIDLQYCYAAIERPIIG
jgi:hypothetical protein